jgi:hypothetical protein
VASPAEVVEQYFDAWTSGNFDAARALLRDDMSFRGPIDTFDNADALLASIKGLAQIVTGSKRRGLIADGGQVAVIYDLHTQPVPTSHVAEWYRVEDGKIVSMEAFFDARPFAALFGQQGH